MGRAIVGEKGGRGDEVLGAAVENFQTGGHQKVLKQAASRVEGIQTPEGAVGVGV